METKIDIGSLVRIANDDSRALYIVDGVVGCDFRLLDKAGGWSLMDRSSVVLADDQTAAALADSFPGRAASLAAVDSALAEIDALADQFTGDDLGAKMAEAESSDVLCNECLHNCVASDADGHASGEVGTCEIFFYQFRALNMPRQCGDFEPLPVEPLRPVGYRVGDAHATDATDPAAGEG